MKDSKYPLSIGMATCNDFSGCVMTVRNLMDNNAFEAGKLEIVVVDNSPDNNYANALRGQITKMGPHVKYYRHEALEGPASSKNRVFAESAGVYTTCVDSHVYFNRGIIDRLLDFVENIPEDKKDDFFTGPLLGNDGGISTHWEDRWRGEMRGIWSTDKSLVETDDLKPIWGNGCGCFMVKTDSWLGFNPNYKAFGAEEGVIHDKYRKHGKEVWLIPWLRWYHRFGNPDTKHYCLSRYGKVRNYVLGYQELGQPLDDIYSHFVSMNSKGDLKKHLIEEHSYPEKYLENKTVKELISLHRMKKLPEEQWRWLLNDPIKNEEPEKSDVLDSYNAEMNNKNNDLNEHFATIRKYAEQCKSVAEITRRPYSSLPILAAKPKKMLSFSYDSPLHPLLNREGVVAAKCSNFNEAVSQLLLADNVDMIFLKPPHKADNTKEILSLVSKKVNKYIILHDTKMKYRPDMKEAMKALVDSKEWHVIEHTNNQWGLTVLGRQKPEKRVYAWVPERGVGTELKKLLKKIGIESSPNCSCNKRADFMDLAGIKWAEENQATIESWLAEEAAKRKNKFYTKIGAMTLIKLAIWKAKKQEEKENKKQLAEVVG